MRLSKNEKRVLRLLFDNSKTSDVKIAEWLSLSKQAVGIIKKKLEPDFIKGYTVELDWFKLGINVMAIEMVRIEPKRKDGEIIGRFIKNLIKSPHCIRLCRMPEQNQFYAQYAFRNLIELDEYFNNPPYCRKKGCFREDFNIQHDSIKIFSCKSILKENQRDLFNEIIKRF